MTLNFVDEKEKLVAGTPYIIKWDNGEDIKSPVFTGVTIDNTNRSVTSTDGTVTFKGNYDYRRFETEDKSILFLGSKNTLYWPQPGVDDAKKTVIYPSIGACRAYFDLGTYEAREFVLNFDDQTTGVIEVKEVNEVKDNSWYTLNGVKLSGKPTQAGLYIHNGKKVIIK